MSVVFDQTSGAEYATLSDAISGSAANDVLLVPAGSYVEDFPQITHSLTIEAVGGLASLTTPLPTPSNGRAILDVPFDAGVNLTISGIELSGATRPEPYPNGAGILFETGNGLLTVTNSWIHDNEDGILTGGADSASPGGVMSAVIDHSELSHNGAPPGSSYAVSGTDHNIYAGTLTSLTLTNSYVTDVQGHGHEVKSRAQASTIENNRIQDGPTAIVSYDIDLALGGNDVVTGNVIEKGPGSVNHGMIHFGGEGTWPSSSLFVGGNTFIDDSGAFAKALLNQTVDANSGDTNYNHDVPGTITGNTLYQITPGNLFEDDHGPPLDIASNNTFAAGPEPVLGTSPGYNVSGPFTPIRTLIWTGLGDSDFANPRNWNDTTGALNPAKYAPDLADRVVFNGVAGAVSGTGTAAVVDVGSAGSGVLQLSGGAVLTAGSLDAGLGATDVGQIGLSGAGTRLNISGSAVVADDGTAVLSVLGGATFTAASLTIGALGHSSGAVVISGAGSLIDLTGVLNVGTALGTGDITIGAGATLQAAVLNFRGQEVLQGGLADPTLQLIDQGQSAGGYGTIAADTIIDEGVIQAGSGKLVVQGTVLGGGALSVNGSPRAASPEAVLRINAGATLELTGAVLNAASTTFSDALAPASSYTLNNSVVDVTFADGSGVLSLDDIGGFAGTIATFHGGDKIVITSGTLSALDVINNQTLTISDSGAGGDGIDRISFGDAVTPSGFSIVNGNTIQVACFAKGTRVETADGPVAVEDLSVGNQIVTLDGTREPIVWIGDLRVDCETHTAPETVWPVRIARGAFFENVPARDLYLSPDHAVFVNDVLVPAKLLVNGISIVQVTRPRVRYFHIELQRHAIVLAEGLAVESYLHAGDETNFRRKPVSRQRPGRPTHTAANWEALGAAPLVLRGPELAAARGMICGAGILTGPRADAHMADPREALP